MAIYHLNVKNLSRSQGRSSVAASAYRAAEKLLDERQDITFDYSKKKGVVYSEILSPEDAPEWVKDRSTLWNTIEHIEKRKDARLAREVMVALPAELTTVQNIDLLKEFCQSQFVDKGMVADINIHLDHAHNPHAHILLTTRAINESGFGLKNTDWNKRERVFEYRKALEEVTNRHLQLAGFEARIDCRSLKARGLAIEPALHLGPAVHHGVSRGEGEQFVRYVDHLEILRANGERVINNPCIALEKLTQQQSVFTEFDIAKTANRFSADLAQYYQVFDAIKNHESIVMIGQDDYKNTVYSTQEMIRLEHQMLNDAYDLDLKKSHGVKVNESLVADKTLSPGQEAALAYLTAPGDLKVMTGLAGTGKSYVMGIVREAYLERGFNVKGAALSGIAAQSLEEGSGIPSQTVDSLLLQWGKGSNPLTSKDIFVIDEAGMLGTGKMAQLLDKANTVGAKVILVHDTEQLSAIQFGAPSRAIAERFGEISLTDVIRQKDPEMQKATLEFGKGQTEKALERYDALGALYTTAVDEKVAQKLMVEAWASDRLEGKSQLMLAFTNDSVKSLNESAREIRVHAGEIEKGTLFNVERGERAFSVGDRIYFLRNDRYLGINNGTLGTIRSFKHNAFEVLLDGKTPKTVSFDLSRYNHIDYGYAATVCKSQGVTVDDSYILLSSYFDRHLTYVAGTRHRNSVKFYSHLEEFKNQAKLFKCLSRERSKSMAVDFAEARWIEPKSPDAQFNPHTPTQSEQAFERQEIKTLNTHISRDFSFARAYERLKGFIEGIVTLSNHKSLLCIRNENQTKLVPLEPSQFLDRHLEKKVEMTLDKEARVSNCSITEHHQNRRVVRDGKALEHTVSKERTQVLTQEKTVDHAREQSRQVAQDKYESGIEL
jgi:Ti-type conjugative transfer relaxase TraA